MIVAFDCDGTLIDYEGKPRESIINLLKAFQAAGYCHVVVWSGGGIDYAKQIARNLNLTGVTIHAKGSIKVDLAIDDQEVKLGLVNMAVPPE